MIRFLFRLFSAVRQWLSSLVYRFDRTPRLIVIRADELPKALSSRYLYVVGERGEDWYAVIVCPCGCGALIELNLVPQGRPCWRLTTDANESPTLWPSVWRQVDCRAHFFVKGGRIIWANEATEGRAT